MTDFNVNKIRERRTTDRGRKLSFASKCAALAASYLGFKPWVVGKVFGVSELTASYIAGCITDDRPPVTMELPDSDGNLKIHILGDLDISHLRRENRKKRYQDVAAEFSRLGRDEFLRVYYHERDIERFLLQARNQPRPQRDTWSPNPKANKYEGDHRVGYYEVPMRVTWLADKGWAWSQLNEDMSQDGWYWKGVGESYPDEEGFKPFRTSDAAFAAAKKLLHAE